MITQCSVATNSALACAEAQGRCSERSKMQTHLHRVDTSTAHRRRIRSATSGNAASGPERTCTRRAPKRELQHTDHLRHQTAVVAGLSNTVCCLSDPYGDEQSRIGTFTSLLHERLQGGAHHGGGGAVLVCDTPQPPPPPPPRF